MCHLPYIYAIARDKVGAAAAAAAAAVVVWRQRRSRPFSFAASFAYHLAIATLLLCAGWLAGSLSPTSGRISREESRHIRFGQSAPKEEEKRKKNGIDRDTHGRKKKQINKKREKDEE